MSILYEAGVSKIFFLQINVAVSKTNNIPIITSTLGLKFQRRRSVTLYFLRDFVKQSFPILYTE